MLPYVTTHSTLSPMRVDADAASSSYCPCSAGIYLTCTIACTHCQDNYPASSSNDPLATLEPRRGR